MSLYRYGVHITPEQVHDGDTITGFDLDLGFNVWLRDRDARLYGIDTPELKGKTQRERDLAVKAREHLRTLIARAKSVQIESVEKPDKYGRLLVRVFTVSADGAETNAADSLVAAGLAHRYDGGTKQPW